MKGVQQDEGDTNPGTMVSDAVDAPCNRKGMRVCRGMESGRYRERGE